MYQSRIENVKRDKTLSKGEKDSEIASCQKELEQAKAVEAQNKDQIAKLIGKAENYLKNNFDKYYNAVKASLMVSRGATPSRTESPCGLQRAGDGVLCQLGRVVLLGKVREQDVARAALHGKPAQIPPPRRWTDAPPSPRMRRLRK